MDVLPERYCGISRFAESTEITVWITGKGVGVSEDEMGDVSSIASNVV